MLKLGELYEDIQRLAAESASSWQDRSQRLQQAVSSFQTHAERHEWWRGRIAASDTRLHLAAFLGPPDEFAPPPEPPVNHQVLATDGSQIFPDQHGPTDCFVINIGQVTLSYGEDASAELNSSPSIYPRNEPFFRGVLGQRQMITADEVSALRAVLELKALLELANTQRTLPFVALVDGKLIPWSWRSDKNNAFKLDMFEQYMEILDGFRQRKAPIAAYVSRSRANEITNLVRIGDCTEPSPICAQCSHLAELRRQYGSDQFPPEAATVLPCGGPAGLGDQDLFSQLLKVGWRSATYSERRDPDPHFEELTIFCYLNTGPETQPEIGRIEMPAWLGEDEAGLELVHGVVVDQLLKGRGYPVALSEAHEQAVVRAPDRRAFHRLLERQWVQQQLPLAMSHKRFSKERPAV